MTLREWIREWLTIDREVCRTCEVLKEQLAIERQFNKVMFEKLTKEETRVEYQPLQERVPIIPKHIPWAVQRQMLEAEDRRKAQVLRQNTENLKQRDSTVEELEERIGITEGDRNASQNS